MISETMSQALNGQFNRELYSSYFYLILSAHSESLGLKGMASWFMAKHQEELDHSMKFYRYLLDQGAVVRPEAVDRPPSEFEGPRSMFEQTLDHEQGVTRSINNLVDTALAERDHATHIFLQWFITEQIEEEAVVGDVLARLRLVGERGEGLFLMDQELGRMAQALMQPAATN